MQWDYTGSIFDTMMTMMLARTIMAATKHDVFEVLASGPLTAGEVARRGDSPSTLAQKAGQGRIEKRGLFRALTNGGRPLLKLTIFSLIGSGLFAFS